MAAPGAELRLILASTSRYRRGHPSCG